MLSSFFSIEISLRLISKVDSIFRLYANSPLALPGVIITGRQVTIRSKCWSKSNTLILESDQLPHFSFLRCKWNKVYVPHQNSLVPLKLQKIKCSFSLQNLEKPHHVYLIICYRGNFQLMVKTSCILINVLT